MTGGNMHPYYSSRCIQSRSQVHDVLLVRGSSADFSPQRLNARWTWRMEHNRSCCL